MNDKPAHLCLTCNLAKWHRTSNGRVLPDGEGKCEWEPVHIPTPAVWKWGIGGALGKQPAAYWIVIDRNRPITDCETYEAKS